MRMHAHRVGNRVRTDAALADAEQGGPARLPRTRGTQNAAMSKKLHLLFCAAVLAAAGAHADAPPPMTEQELEAEREAIDARYEAQRAACDRLKGRAEDLCRIEAKGERSIARASLEARHAPSPQAQQEVRVARAEAAHALAHARCQALEGRAEARCERQADASLEAAVRHARVEKVEALRAAEARARREAKASRAS